MTYDMGTARSRRRVAELLEIAGQEAGVIRQLSDCLKQLDRAQAAKRELSDLTPAEDHDAVALRQSISRRDISA